jgi:hypothetical protein
MNGTKKSHHDYGMANGHAPIAARVACIDFDGTIVPWGPLIDPAVKPTPGAVKAIQRIKKAGYRIVIFTSRMSGTWLKDAGEDPRLQGEYVQQVLDKYGIPWDTITAEKIPAEFYIDDKGIEFTGTNWRAITNRVLKPKEQAERKAEEV